nr:16S rRNA (cytosine(1402)-N(4))-methyltransferase RsmH [Bacteroidota bacterium]
ALPIDGLLADLGVSSHQFDEGDRGFSTRFDTKLDMRMDRNAKQTAADILNTYSEEELKHIFKLYGEVDNAGRLAYSVFHSRKEKQIETVNDLKTAIEKCVKRGRENQYFAQVFQALRIEVNKELDVLKDLLLQCLEVLKPGGRLVVISYHSLEDRLVKNIMRSGKFEGEVEKDFYGNQLAPFKQITRKPIVPSEEENKENSRARSAKLRIAEKK